MLRRTLQFLTVLAALAAVAVGASAIAGAASSGGSSNNAMPAPPAGQRPPGPHPGETELTGDTADKVRRAALGKVPGATVLRVETDAEGSPYEAHLRKSAGRFVTVKVDKKFNATDVQSGFGAGPPAGRPGGSN